MNRIRRMLIYSGILSLFIPSAYAQVGINNLDPDSTAVLDMSGPANIGRGLLLPKMSEADRLAITTPANGLMVMDTTSEKIFYFDATPPPGHWVQVVGMNETNNVSSVDSAFGVGTDSPAEMLDVAGNIKAQWNVYIDSSLKVKEDAHVQGNGIFDKGITVAENANVNGNIVAGGSITADSINIPGFAPNALVPTGAIMMWSGTTPPPGWALCDGTNGTPNLQGKFIVGYDNPSDGTASDPVYQIVGETGGADGVTLTANQSGLPAHTHGVTDPGHTHSLDGSNGRRVTPLDVNSHASSTDATLFTTIPTNSATTGITVNSNTSQNAADAHENRPPFYVLAYIIKL